MRFGYKRVFLDYNATTPTDRRVFWSMFPYFSRNFANPAAFYKEGLKAAMAVDNSRMAIGKVCGVKKEEVIFTSSGTEANNLALSGFLSGLSNDETNLFSSWKNKNWQIIVSEIEHPSVLETANEINKNKKAEVLKIKILNNGKADLKDFQNKLSENTVLVSIMLVNNEIGTIAPIRDISREIKKFKNKLNRSFDEPPYLHTDASQAPCFLDINLDRLGVDMMTLDGSKIYGPKGVGCLIKKFYVPMTSIMQGGSQEFGYRPGTSNVSGIVGLAKAVTLASKNQASHAEKIKKVQKYFFEQIEKHLPQAKINGSTTDRIPNNVNFCIPKLNSELAVIQLDEEGVACSAMSACKNTSEDAVSYVVGAIDKDCQKSSLRFGLGPKTSKKDIDFVIKKIKKIIQ